jgi:flagellar FliL protein
MASEEDKANMDENKSGGDASSQEEKKKSGGSKKLLMFGGIGVVAVVLGVVIALLVVKPMVSGSGSHTDETAELESSEDKAKEADSKKDHAKPKKKKKASGHGSESSSIYTIKDIVINPSGTGGTRFLSVSFAFELESAELGAELEAREPVIRDALITILSSKTVAQLTDPKQKEIVRYQIKKRVSKLLHTDELAGVYYTDFVLQ